MDDILAHINFVAGPENLHDPPTGEGDDVIQIGAVAHELFLLKPGTDETFRTIHIEFRIGDDHLASLDHIKRTDLGTTLPVLAVTFTQSLEIGNGIIREIGQVMLCIRDLLLYPPDLFDQLIDVKPVNTAHRLFGELEDILPGDIPLQQFSEGLEGLVDGFNDQLPSFMLLLQFLVDLLFEEDLFERCVMPFGFELFKPDLQFSLQQVAGLVRRNTQQVRYADEYRTIVNDHTGVRGDAHFAVGEGVECIDGDVRGNPRRQFDIDLHFCRCVVGHFLDLDLALIVGLDDRIHQLGGRHTIGDIPDHDVLLIDLFDMCPTTDPSAAFTIIVGSGIDHAAGEEIGQQLEFLSAQVLDRGIDQFIEIMGQDLGGKSHCDAVGTLREQEREFHRKGDGLLLAAVVTQLPFGGFVIEGHFEGELAEPGLDVSGGGSIITRTDISPVALGIDEQVLLSQIHQGILDTGVTMRMILHRLADDVRRLVEAPIVHFLHGMEDASLHGFQAVFYGRHRPFQDHV